MEPVVIGHKERCQRQAAVWEQWSDLNPVCLECHLAERKTSNDRGPPELRGLVMEAMPCGCCGCHAPAKVVNDSQPD